MVDTRICLMTTLLVYYQNHIHNQTIKKRSGTQAASGSVRAHIAPDLFPCTWAGPSHQLTFKHFLIFVPGTDAAHGPEL